MKLKTLLIALLLPVSLQASVILPSDTLLENGGFEDTNVRTGSWQYYTSTHNSGVDLSWEYGDSAMEIWGTPFLGVTAHEGRNIAELNAHGRNNAAYSFRQTFDTEIGQTYHYGFSYRARNNHSESFFAGIIDINANTLFDDHVTGQWSVFASSFVATSTQSTIAFTSNDHLGDTTGNLIDAVYVTAQVPEPGTLALLGLGIIGLGLARRRSK